jgi:hypothetical protein
MKIVELKLFKPGTILYLPDNITHQYTFVGHVYTYIKFYSTGAPSRQVVRDKSCIYLHSFVHETSVEPATIRHMFLYDDKKAAFNSQVIKSLVRATT